MKIIYLGLIYDKKKEQDYINNSKNGMQNAINTFQYTFIDGLIEQEDVYTTIINTVPVGIFPFQYKRLFLKSRKWYYNEILCNEIGYINLPILKMKYREIFIKKEIEKFIKQYPNEPIKIICYSLYLPFLKICKIIKKKYPQVHFCFVITDLPSEFGILPHNPIKKQIYIMYGNKTLKMSKYIDSYVLLTKQMIVPLKIEGKKYTIVEGIARNDSISNNNTNENKKTMDKKIVFYSGTLAYEFGILNLLDAFKLITSQEYELWICGSGQAEKEIRSIAQIDHRVKYWGYLEKSRALQLQQQATVVVNPRQNIGEYVKYSFPSKTMEYLISGIPMIGYKLDGIPDEYDSFIFYVSDNSKEALKNKLIEVCNMPYEERTMHGLNAKNFIKENKNSRTQIKKVIEMLGES